MVETAPGMLKMSNPPGTHDYVLTVIGIITADLVSQPEVGTGSFWSAVGYDRNLVRARPSTAAGTPVESLLPAAFSRPIWGTPAAVYAAQRGQSEAEREGFGFVLPGTANDPGRFRGAVRREPTT
jgi:hypothetical protein